VRRVLCLLLVLVLCVPAVSARPHRPKAATVAKVVVPAVMLWLAYRIATDDDPPASPYR
jgi:hypothetical protein